MLENLNPSKVFFYFEQISKIPRISHNEKEIANYLIDFAIKKSFKYKVDIYNNVIIYKKGSEGYETNEPVILQGHLDMVASKEDNVEHDFLIDPIEFIVSNDFIKGNGTTLGADNGIAVAYMLAILDSDDLMHPPIECVFTSCEESDMSGAFNLKTENLKGKTLISLDTEEEGTIITGGAGGINLSIQIPVSYTQANGILFRVSINDLASGHSGFDIIKERANGIKLLGRLMYYLNQRIDYSVKYIKGGSEDSIIPNFAYIDFIIDKKDRDAFVYAINTYDLILKNEYKQSEPNINLKFEYKGEVKCCNALDRISQKNISFFLMLVPNGIRKMSREVLNLVQTSSNIGTIRLKGEELITTHLIRSNIASEAKALYDSMSVLSQYMDGFIKINGEIPAWNGNSNSYLINLVKPLYYEVYKKEPIITSMHGMLECGILDNKIKHLEAISIGPNIFDAHSPNERLEIESVEKVWLLLIKILERL